MKKIHLVLLLTILLGGTAYMGFSTSPKSAEPVKGGEQKPVKLMPDFTLSDINGKPYSIHQLAGNKPTLFIYFSSTCHLCQDELGAISKRIDEFKDYNLILTTVQPVEEIMGFVASLGIKDKSNVHFLLDSEMQVASFYQIRSVPSLYVYNANKELVAEYVGITEIDLLKEKLALGK